MEQRQEMHVHIAETGKTFQILAGPATTVSGLKESMAVLSSIAIKHQVLITPNGLSLDNGEALLSSFGSQEPNQNLYLFNLQSTVSQSQIPNLMDLRAFDFKLPDSVSNPNPSVLSASTSILVRNLPDFERDFRLHYLQAKAFYDGAEKRKQGCIQCLEQMRIQSYAINAVVANLTYHCERILPEFEELKTDMKTQRAIHREILENFEPSLANLRHHAIHKIQSVVGRQTLLDCIQEKSFRILWRECAAKYEKTHEQFLDLGRLIDDITASVDEAKTHKGPFEEEFLDKNILRCDEFILMQQTLNEVLENDLKQVNITVNTMADELKNEKSISDAGDVCKALDNQSQQHFSQLAQMRGYDEQIVEIMNSFRQRQRVLLGFFYKTLTKVGELETKMHSVGHRITLVKAALHSHKKDFKRFNELQRLPEMYKAALVEVARRRAFVQQFIGRSDDFVESLKALRAPENARRKLFNKQYGGGLIHDLIPGLKAKATYFEMKMKEMDKDLPKIDLKDLDITDDSEPVDSEPLNLNEKCQRLEDENNYLKAQVASSNLLLSASPSMAFSESQSILREKDSAMDALRGELESSTMSLKQSENVLLLKDSEISAAKTDITRVAEENKKLKEVHVLNDKLREQSLKEKEEMMQAHKESVESYEKKLLDLEKRLDTVSGSQKALIDPNTLKDMKTVLGGMPSLKKKVEELQTQKESLEKRVENLDMENKRMAQNQALMMGERRDLEERASMWRRQCEHRVTFKNFAIHDVVLFFKNDSGHWELFSSTVSHWYLARDIVESILASLGTDKPDHIMGQVVMMMPLFTSSQLENPFGLADGTQYRELVVEVRSPGYPTSR